jgi:GAF domain-containing protein
MADHSSASSATASVSAGIAAANAHLPKAEEPGARFPGEDGGRSLAEMAQRDLDATLQLLAERAQYITGASGAAIALRRGQHNDMLCRASAGSNAPELGALLSMEYGLSGESVRTRQTLRCDDTERDARVNREGCRQLGIASVVVMPVVYEEQVLGVFELFSGRANAFEERDLSALRRLSEMVETAVKHAVASQAVPAADEPVAAGSEATRDVDVIVAETAPVESAISAVDPDTAPMLAANELSPIEEETAELKDVESEETDVEKPGVEETQVKIAPRKPLFWSAAMQTRGSAGQADGRAELIAVPPVLRNLQKCQACGFPVSQGRTFCVECEEKQWRGQPLPQPQSVLRTSEAGENEVAVSAAVIDGAKTVQNLSSAPTSEPASEAPIAEVSSSRATDVAADRPASGDAGLFLSSALPSESWFAANKYVLAALLAVGVVIGVIVWLR